jgi:acetyl-CoA carboxylase biotin carboxyl carrier protein
VTRVTPEDIRALVELFDKSNWQQLHVIAAGADLFISKDPQARRGDGAPLLSSRPTSAAAQSPPEARPLPPERARVESNSQRAKGDADAAVRKSLLNGAVVEAPSMGTFYASPKPGAPPFVSVGQKITADTELCLIEVMKLFTTVRAGVEGTLEEIMVRDSELVELRQPLFRISRGN